ncbi:MAG: hypothetical protein NUW37_10910 [Planctomycetes bacterium]|nr:hypothetical protein [Planctomycetota bacterium]
MKSLLTPEFIFFLVILFASGVLYVSSRPETFANLKAKFDKEFATMDLGGKLPDLRSEDPAARLTDADVRSRFSAEIQRISAAPENNSRGRAVEEEYSGALPPVTADKDTSWNSWRQRDLFIFRNLINLEPMEPLPLAIPPGKPTPGETQLEGAFIGSAYQGRFSRETRNSPVNFSE